MNRSLIASTLVAALTAAFACGAQAQTKATMAEANAMVKKGISYIKTNGKDKGHAEITNKAGAFVDRDLYLVVYAMDGTVRAHGANDKMVG